MRWNESVSTFSAPNGERFLFRSDFLAVRRFRHENHATRISQVKIWPKVALRRTKFNKCARPLVKAFWNLRMPMPCQVFHSVYVLYVCVGIMNLVFTYMTPLVFRDQFFFFYKSQWTCEDRNILDIRGRYNESENGSLGTNWRSCRVVPLHFARCLNLRQTASALLLLINNLFRVWCTRIS